jgi:hypothetical protein
VLARSGLVLLILLLVSPAGLRAREDPLSNPKPIVAKERLRLTHPVRVVSAVDFTPRGECVASGAGDGIVRLWDARSGRERRQLHASNSPVSAVCFSPDGHYLVSGGDDGVVHLWNADSGKELHRMTGHNGPISGLCFSPDGKTIASGSHDGSARIWTVANGTEVLVAAEESSQRMVNALCFTSDGRGLALGLLGGNIEMWRTTPGRRPDWNKHGNGNIGAFALSPDGKTLASTDKSDPYEVVLWEMSTGEVRASLSRDQGILQVAFAADGRSLFFGRMDGEIWSRSPAGKARHLGSHDGRVSGLVLSRDGHVLASSSLDGTVRLWDVPLTLAEDRFAEDNPAVDISAAAAQSLFKELQGTDATAAYRAIQELSHSPSRALPLLREHVKPIQSAVFEQISRHIADLDDNSFAVRERASAELGQLGATAEPALTAAMASDPSAEVRRRITELLEHAAYPLIPTPQEVFQIRCTELLEAIGTPEASAILKQLAGGSNLARLTREARAALERLERRPR